MGKLIVDHNFVGFSDQVGLEIFRSSKRGRKHPARCTNGGEPFEINGVRSLGASHQVRKRSGGVWIKLLPMAVIEWKSPNGVFGSDDISEQLAKITTDPTEPNDMLHRVHGAVEKLHEAQSLVETAARALWGIRKFESEYEYLLRDSRYLDIAQKKIKERFSELVGPPSTPESIVSKQSEVCPSCGGKKEVDLAFCSEICWPKLPKELRKSLRKSVGAVYEEAFGEALYVLGVENPIVPPSPSREGIEPAISAPK